MKFYEPFLLTNRCIDSVCMRKLRSPANMARHQLAPRGQLLQHSAKAGDVLGGVLCPLQVPHKRPAWPSHIWQDGSNILSHPRWAGTPALRV